MNTIIPKYMLEIALLGVAKKAVRRTLECVQIKGNIICATNSQVAISVTNPPSYLTDVNVLITGPSLTAALKAFAKETDVTLSVSGGTATLSSSNGAVVPLETMDDYYPNLASINFESSDRTKINIGGAHLAIPAKVSAILAKYSVDAPAHCTITFSEHGMIVTFGDLVKIIIAGFIA